ncbi:signal transduction histidine kinase [Planomicrobium stackebrandtii]|uniref:histidine kinase n=1 Tax=Planomicrobium stackebrandtii TaxID=253160 RepID=A0ABU0GV37_9BACL|nr:ATP-binding protein [Planomicrobium stackebrandtii]MDQ0429225.1 signal transduction histidine kinase [Planomicrobium stackebrandtii]
MKKVIKFIPIWKILLYIVLAVLLTAGTAQVFIFALYFLETQSSRLADFIELSGSFGLVPIILLCLLPFALFVSFFYLIERQRYIESTMKNMMKEMESIAKGQFDQELTNEDEGVIGELAREVNQIILQLEGAKAEQKKAAEIKNDLITNVAHDLRSPLTSIVGYLDLINEDRYKSEVELRYYIQIIHQKSHELNQLLNDLFEYTLVQNKEALINEVPINLEEMMNQLSVQFQFQLKEAGMEMRQHFSFTERPFVMGEGPKLARVFENLIENAIRYGKEGKYIDLSVKESEELIEIEIASYGQAIPSIDLPYLFERFYRVEKSRSQYTGGSGLGLAIVKSILELHGGQIRAESTLGKTAFVVKLPKKSEGARVSIPDFPI